MTNRKLGISDPCKALATELETGQSIMAPWAKVVQFNCNDEADAKICASQGIVSYPTVRIVRSARQSRYRGAFTATGSENKPQFLSFITVPCSDCEPQNCNHGSQDLAATGVQG